MTLERKIKLFTFISFGFYWFTVLTSTGNTFCGTGESLAIGGRTAWTSPGNIVSDNTTDATCNAGSGSDYLVARNFGFALPSGVSIIGITVISEASEHSGGTESVNCVLQNASGTIIGTAKALTYSGTGKSIYTYGGAADLWGTNVGDLTEAVVEDPDFGARLYFNTSHDVRIDYVQIAVEYQTPLGHRVIVVSKK